MELALGPLDMTPDEFWDSTLADIEARAKGWRWRVERARERDAWMLANLIQPHTKKRIKAKDFLTEAETTADKRKKFDEMVRRAKESRRA